MDTLITDLKAQKSNLETFEAKNQTRND